MASRDAAQPSQEGEGKREEKAEVAGSSPLLKLGTLVVIGAMAANVFGFRYSRWAVGKDIHRGWETHARNVARQAARARANARKQAESGAYSRAQAQQKARAKEQERAEQRAKEYAKREQRAKDEHDNTRQAYQRWEETFTHGGYQRRVRVEFDSRFEDMFRGPFGIPEEVLREFLRTAQMSQARGRVEDFDAFRFWEQVHGPQWRQAGGASSGPGRAGAGSGRGGMGSGVFSGNRARHYAVLGLRDDATADEVKAAYRKEAMKWHPDRYRGPDKAGAEKKFREVTEAYEALK